MLITCMRGGVLIRLYSHGDCTSAYDSIPANIAPKALHATIQYGVGGGGVSHDFTGISQKSMVFAGISSKYVILKYFTGISSKYVILEQETLYAYRD